RLERGWCLAGEAGRERPGGRVVPGRRGWAMSALEGGLCLAGETGREGLKGRLCLAEEGGP
ncbi:MAG TPA: hypothetical protein VNO81_12145, partial [Candidatus Nitrosotenuis sp.]|nr:hypothetical protein [Candidatus Nitrosotenuis sp.]